MAQLPSADVEANIADCRVILSVSAFIAVFIDPTRPTLTGLLPLTGGPFMLDPWALGVMLSHLAYSLAVAIAMRRWLAGAARIAQVSTWLDVAFGAAIALVTEGANSPFYVFFAFAVVSAAFRSGLRLTLAVTATSVAAYLSLIVVSHPAGLAFYVMRPAYLAITGWLVGYLGEQRLLLEARLRGLEAAAQRERIARSLHDEYVQALSAVNVRLETCRGLLGRDRPEQALVELTELQAGVNREHDELRRYIRSLIDGEPARPPGVPDNHTRIEVTARFAGSVTLVEHALQIMLEGARNVARHARAHAAAIRVGAGSERVSITIEDDGVGFAADAPPPWSIASRAAELGGAVRLGRAGDRGAHVEVELPGT